MSIPESSHLSENCIENISIEENKEKVQYLLETFKDSKDIGSLLIVMR